MPGAKPSSLNHFTHCLPTKVVTGKALIPYNLCCMGHPRWTIGASGQQMSLITLRPSVPVKNLGQSSHLTCGRAKRKGNCGPREAGRPPQQLNLFVWVHSMEARGSTSPPQLFACSTLPLSIRHLLSKKPRYNAPDAAFAEIGRAGWGVWCRGLL